MNQIIVYMQNKPLLLTYVLTVACFYRKNGISSILSSIEHGWSHISPESSVISILDYFS